MRRREFIQAAAVLLGAGTAATTGAFADDDELYEIVAERFDEVTAFRRPESVGTSADYVRMYDAETETLAYATTADGDADDIMLAVRDLSEVEFAA